MILDNINKLLIIRLSSLGDILLTTPVIRAIKKQYPKIIIDFLLKEQYYDLLKNNPYINNIYTYKSNSKTLQVLTDNLINNKYDLVVDLQNNLRSAAVSAKLNSLKLKFNKHTISKFLLVKFKINKLRDAVPIPVRYANAINGLKLDSLGLDLYTDNKPNNSLNKENLYIGFAPGARHFTKRWLEDYYISLGRMLVELGFIVLLFGGKTDKEICSKIASSIPNAVNLSNENDILQTAADMKLCKAIICNDSGLMHAATAAGVPVLTFFGSSVKEFGFTPYRAKNLILEIETLTCRPCSHIGRDSCPKKHFKCMREISPNTALNKLKLLLNSK